jgi:hypothetical protein
VGSRERKRAERRKRKRRSAEHRGGAAEVAAPTETAPADGSGRSPADLARRTEAKNEAAREALEPLREGERPLVVTIGTVLSALLCVSIVAGYVAGVEVSGERPPILQVVAPVVLIGIMAWGMWRARYWAVLGFQTVLVFSMLWAAISLVAATDPFKAIGNFVLIAVAGTLFYFMIKALARIQMPDRLPRR